MGKLIFRFFLTLLILVVLTTLALCSYLFFSLYKPLAIEPLLIRNPQQAILIPNQPYSITTLNIGYGVMDQQNAHIEQRLQTAYPRPDNAIHDNLNTITDQLVSIDSDIYTLQEVDLNAKRSHFINQSERISAAFPNHSSAFAYMFNSPYIPYPVKEQTGELKSGLLTLSRYQTTQEVRYALPSISTFPKAITEPQYALLETKLPVRGNKQLIVAHLQLAHTIATSTLPHEQITFLNTYIATLTKAQGNYIILSGDWAHLIDTPTFSSSEPWPISFQKFPAHLKSSPLSWTIDKRVPTTRSTYYSYQPNLSFVSITDGFLISSNIEVVSTDTSSYQFAASDHNPVTLRFILKP